VEAGVAQRLVRPELAYPLEARYFVVEPNCEQFVELARLADAQRVRPVIDTVFALSEARKAFERVVMRGKRGKVVLNVGDGQPDETAASYA
jgi:NADPH:quinone reductase-like Zn-dependent oxidoreductase